MDMRLHSNGGNCTMPSPTRRRRSMVSFESSMNRAMTTCIPKRSLCQSNSRKPFAVVCCKRPDLAFKPTPLHGGGKAPQDCASAAAAKRRAAPGETSRPFTETSPHCSMPECSSAPKAGGSYSPTRRRRSRLSCGRREAQLEANPNLTIERKSGRRRGGYVDGHDEQPAARRERSTSRNADATMGRRAAVAPVITRRHVRRRAGSPA